MKVSVRGIYSTGLISLLRELGYEITNLSKKQEERFNINSKEKEDISIFDLKDKSGIVIIGKNTDKLIEDFRNIFWDSLFFNKDVGIYNGKYVEIGKTDGIVFETNEDKKREIIEKLLNKISGLNIKFKEECNRASIEEIEEEIFNIKKYYINFGYNSKLILDEYRKKVTQTVKNHHVYRRTISDILNFSEILLKYVDEDKIDRAIKEYIIEKIRDRGFIRRYHRKVLENKLISYLELVSDVKLLENNRIYLETLRVITSDGIYDGLGIEKEKGDYVITKYIENEWYFVIEYYNKDRKLKGRYININTPLEITTKIFYNDLCIDIIDVGEKRVVDREELDLLYNKKIISEKLYKKALEISDRILKNEL